MLAGSLGLLSGGLTYLSFTSYGCDDSGVGARSCEYDFGGWSAMGFALLVGVFVLLLTQTLVDRYSEQDALEES